MLNIEKRVALTAASVLAVMAGLVAYSIWGLGIKLPGCTTIANSFSKGEIIQKSDNLYEVHMVARMWSFDPQLIKVKPNTTLDIYLASQDVTHGFNIENTNVNLMAVPGAINYGRVTLREPGIYHIVCHEYCGAGHQNMSAAIVVGNDVDQPFLLSQLDQSTLGAHATTPDGQGRTLFSAKGCVACHSTDGSHGTGPSFKGLYGRREKMSDGKSVTVDDPYIIESIKDPTAKIVEGFQPVMPKLEVSDEEIGQIISYIKTLKE